MENSDDSNWVSHAVMLGAAVGAVGGLLGGVFPVLAGCLFCCCPLPQLLGPALSLKAFIQKHTGPALQSSDGALYGVLWGATGGAASALFGGIINIIRGPQAAAEGSLDSMMQLVEMLDLDPAQVSQMQEAFDMALAQQADVGVGQMIGSTLVNMFISGAFWGVLGAISGLVYMSVTNKD